MKNLHSTIMRISGNKTEMFCIIGMPGRHSLSPAMYNAAFAKFQMDSIFLAFDVPRENLRGAIEGMRSFGIKGIILTSPHKEKVMGLVDYVDKKANNIGAVNTIINNNNILKGYNTDSDGFYYALKNATGLDNKKFLIFGAGGAARAFVFELAEKAKHPEITIINRNIEHARKLKMAAKRNAGAEIRVFPANINNMQAEMKHADIVVNATNITLENSSKTPVPKRFMRKEQVIFDANYVPLKNRFLRDAESTGCKVINGSELLLGGGISAFRLFTGRDAPVETMRNAIKESLK